MWNERTNSSVLEKPRIQKPEQGDRSIVAPALAELRRSSYAALRHVSVDYRDGVLTLNGSVPNYYQKQVAQVLVQFRLPKVTIQNKLQVLVPTHEPNAAVWVEEPALA